jgi:hypothetical protein
MMETEEGTEEGNEEGNEVEIGEARVMPSFVQVILSLV